MDEPLVSIIMSVYNAESTLEEAIESIAAQTYRNWELVVCDDASTDGTRVLLSRLLDGLENRTKLLFNEQNMRLAYSLNRCLAESSGELIARMDADDYSEPDRLSKQVEFLLSNPGVDLVGTSMRRFNAHGLGEIVQPAAVEPDRNTLARTSRVPFCHATIVARREVFTKLGGYTVSWRTERGQDVDLWFRFFGAGMVGRNLPAALYRVREDEAAVRRRTRRARIGTFVTRIRGNASLRLGFGSYIHAASDVVKILVPYRVLDFIRACERQRSMRSNQEAADK